MRRRGQRWPRRAAQDEAIAATLEEIGDVRVPFSDSPRSDLAGSEPVRVEELLDRAEDEERRELERLGLRRSIDDLGCAQPSRSFARCRDARLAMAKRCVSEGPS